MTGGRISTMITLQRSGPDVDIDWNTGRLLILSPELTRRCASATSSATGPSRCCCLVPSGRRFAAVSCGNRAYSARALAALELHGDFTYTHEVILVAQHLGLVLEELALPIRGQRSHGRSKMADSRQPYGIKAAALIWKTAHRLRSRAGDAVSARSGRRLMSSGVDGALALV